MDVLLVLLFMIAYFALIGKIMEYAYYTEAMNSPIYMSHTHSHTLHNFFVIGYYLFAESDPDVRLCLHVASCYNVYT